MAIENKKEFNYDNYEPIVYTKLEKCENKFTSNFSDLSMNIREDIAVNIKENVNYHIASKRYEITRLIENSGYLIEMNKQLKVFNMLKYNTFDDGLTDYRINKLKLVIADIKNINKRKLSYLVWIREINLKQCDKIQKLEKLLVELDIYNGFFKNGNRK